MKSSRNNRFMRDNYHSERRNKSFQATFFSNTHTRLISPRPGYDASSVERLAGMNTWRRWKAIYYYIMPRLY